MTPSSSSTLGSVSSTTTRMAIRWAFRYEYSFIRIGILSILFYPNILFPNTGTLFIRILVPVPFSIRIPVGTGAVGTLFIRESNLCLNCVYYPNIRVFLSELIFYVNIRFF